MKKARVYTVEKVKRAQEHWDSMQDAKDPKEPKNRWARYKDSPELTEVKKAHQEKYLEDLVAYLNERNATCPPDERLHIHAWYRRWITFDNYSYFITGAILRKGWSNEYAAFLGESNVFYEPFKKVVFLQMLRNFLKFLVDKLNFLNNAGLLNPTVQFESLAEKMQAMIKTSAELNGLFYSLKKLGYLISQLTVWMQRLDNLGTPPTVTGKMGRMQKYHTWLEYFVKSDCDLGKFVKEHLKEAGVNTFGRTGSPI